MKSIYEFEVTSINGKNTTFDAYRNKIMLIVNVASKCGFTSQYDGLEELYKKYNDKGLVVLGFPCNQFGGQEPEAEKKIMDFCRLNYGVTFPMFAKIEVNGSDSHPLYVYLKKQRPGLLGSGTIKWNFTKFLVDQEGKIIHRFSPSTKPEVIEDDIISLL